MDNLDEVIARMNQNRTSLYSASNNQNSVSPAESEEQTIKRKRVAEMSLDEKKVYYDNQAKKLREKLKKIEQKKENMTNVTEKQRIHALIVFGSQFLSREQIFNWYQLRPKERDAAIKEYADSIKKAAGLHEKR